MEDSAVKFVRLTTGEDIISEVMFYEDDKESYYILNNPLKVVYMTGNKPGVLSVSLMQWVFWRIANTQSFTIYPNDVLTVANTTESMEEYYWSSVDHFSEYKEKLSKQTEFDDASFEAEAEDTADALQNILDSIKNLDPKRKLH
jgi:dihydroorotase-like cyclic amidohydrolase